MFTPHNELEQLLVASAADPGHRPAFYRALLETDVLVLGEMDGELDEGEHQLGAGERVALPVWTTDAGAALIAIFSSVERMNEFVRDEERSYVRLNGRTLFEMIEPGISVLLNPASDFGKELTSSEIRQLLDGTLFQTVETVTMKRETQVLLGQPEEYPRALVGALATLFAKHSEVEAAYLAYIVNPEAEAGGHMIIGIESAAPIDDVVAEAGLVARGLIADGEPLDFIRIDEGGISSYLTRETTPFYTRRRGRGLRGLRGIFR